MKYQKVSNIHFYDSAVYQDLLNRLEQIQPQNERRWGTMTTSQMLHHLNLAIGSGLGYYTLPDTSNIISRGITRFLILDVLKRFPKKTKTAAHLEVTDDFDFETEKKLLKEILQKAYETKTNEDWDRHTYFGKMSRKDWGKLIVIHCNHHFQQFNN